MPSIISTVGKGTLTGKQFFTLEIAVNHDNRGCIIVQITDDTGHCFFPGQLTGVVPPVAGNQLIAAIGIGTDDGRNQNAVLPDTVRRFHHGLVILDLKGMVLKRMQFRQGDFHYFFATGVGAAFLGGKQIIY